MDQQTNAARIPQFFIGVVGYSDEKCQTEKAAALVAEAIAEAAHALEVTLDNIGIVSGLTNLGVPALAYQFAQRTGLHTVGIACAKAENYDCFPVNQKIIFGENWGDESEIFLLALDALVQVGGGEQSKREAQAFQEVFPQKPFIYRELNRDGT